MIFFKVVPQKVSTDGKTKEIALVSGFDPFHITASKNESILHHPPASFFLTCPSRIAKRHFFLKKAKGPGVFDAK